MLNRPRNKSYQISRRRILGYGAASAGLSLLPWQWALAQGVESASGANPDAMRKRKIPATGEELAVMGLGSSGAFSTYGSAIPSELTTVMKQFVAMGGEMVDTSPTYGNAETVIGDIARETGVRDELFMATKVHINGKQAGSNQMNESEQLLGKPIDLMQIHNFVDTDTQWATMQQMKAAGQVRYIGLTHYLTSAFDELEQQMKAKDMDFVQFNYSILTPEAENRLLPLAADRGIAVITNRNFDDGSFFSQASGQPLPDYAAEFDCGSWAQFALKYVLANPAVNAVIPATSDPEHLVDNMKAGYGALPDKAMQKRMRATIAAL